MDDIRIHNGDPVAVIRVCENCRAEVRAPYDDCSPAKRTHRLVIPAVATFDDDIRVQVCYPCYVSVSQAAINALDKMGHAR